MAEARQSRFSPSQIVRVVNCKGSVKRAALAPPRPRSSNATSGERARELLAVALQNNIESAYLAHAETSFFYRTPETSVCDAVQEALEWIRETAWSDENSEIFSEIYVEPPVDMKPNETGGSCACVVWLPGSGAAHIIDYSHEQGAPIEAAGNARLLSYAAGFVLNGPVAEKDIKSITCVIIQPRDFHPDTSIRSDEVTKEELRGYVSLLQGVIEEAESEDPPLNPCQEACRNCDAAPSCPALEAQVIGYVRQNAMSVRAIAREGFPDIGELDAERLGMIVAATPHIRKWLDQVKVAATEYARAGNSIPGLKLVESKKTRKWFGSQKDIIALIQRQTGLPIDEIAPRTLEPLTTMEVKVKKAYQAGKSRQGDKRSAAARAAQDLAPALLKSGSGAAVLAPVTDPRPPLDPATYFNQVVPVIAPPTTRGDGA